MKNAQGGEYFSYRCKKIERSEKDPKPYTLTSADNKTIILHMKKIVPYIKQQYEWLLQNSLSNWAIS